MSNLRIDKIRELLDELSIDAMRVGYIPHIRYISGFSGSTALIVITRTKSFFITDFRYKQQAYQQVKGFEIVISYESVEVLKKIFTDENVKRLGFESDHTIFQAVERYKESFPDTELVAVPERLERICNPKTPEEIEHMKKAAEISDKAFEKILGIIKPGMKEIEVSAELTYAHKRFGADKDSFDAIVASGWRGALPHGTASDKIIESGEMVTLDFGCVYKGFCSDVTRTFAVGNPPDEMKKIYDIVLKAQLMAIDACKAGASSKAIDSVARDFINSSGYEGKFGHGLGHGLGIDVHEQPGFNQRTDVVLIPNIVMTVEPGIYVEDLGGVRIEDDVLITESGHEIFNKAPKELIIV